MAKSNGRKSLVIVESPAKAKTINRYLGPDFEVKASMGHIRDLPAKGINVDIENHFEPTYDIMPGKKRVVSALKAAAKNCDTLYLATDLDREGEAIAWHLSEILGVPQDRTYRVIFNAITKSAIKEAFAAPGRIDGDKVMAQQTPSDSRSHRRLSDQPAVVEESDAWSFRRPGPIGGGQDDCREGAGGPGVRPRGILVDPCGVHHRSRRRLPSGMDRFHHPEVGR